MLESVKAAWLWLALQNVDLPWFVLGLSIFLTVLAVRKAAPGAWLWFELRSPFVLGGPAPLGALLHKAFQAIPSVLLGAVLPALATGGDVKAAAIGALVGLVPPLTHEFMAWLPFLPYKGAVSVPKPKAPMLPLLLICLMVGPGIVIGGCSSAAAEAKAARAALKDPCSKLSWATVSAGCAARIAKECKKDDEQCPVYLECLAASEKWEACK